jgi:hypothetical protein
VTNNEFHKASEYALKEARSFSRSFIRRYGFSHSPRRHNTSTSAFVVADWSTSSAQGSEDVHYDTEQFPAVAFANTPKELSTPR